MKDEFEVDVKDLPLQSHGEVIVVCDYCGKEFPYKYQNYTNRCSPNLLDACTDCKHLKCRDSVRQKYGVDCVFELDKVKEKSKNTCLQKYGVEHYSQTQEYRDSNVKEKILKGMVKNNNIPISSQEIKVCEMLKSLYGNDNCFPSYVLKNVVMDCMVIIKNIKVDIEYDGWYWHKNRQKEDRRRDEFIKSQGYKILRIKAKREIPSYEQILESINKLIETNHNYNEIILDIR